jgi:hypothetical protein
LLFRVLIMPTPLPPNTPREYVHRPCGYTTIMPENVIRAYLQNPHKFRDTTYCAHCQREVPDSECFLVETGESLRAYMERLQHIPQAALETSHATPTRTLDMNVRGFHRYLALTLFFLCTILPVDCLWKEGKLDPQNNAAQTPPRFGPRFGPRLGQQAAEEERSGVEVTWYLWPLAVGGSILAMMLYCPNWGFKRFALLGGPIAGIGALMFLSYWLTGRDRIYRFEPVLIALLGAAPGVGLWVLFILRKATQRGMHVARMER